MRSLCCSFRAQLVEGNGWFPGQRGEGRSIEVEVERRTSFTGSGRGFNRHEVVREDKCSRSPIRAMSGSEFNRRHISWMSDVWKQQTRR